NAKVQGRQVVLADYFINNDLKYLKGGSLSRRYITSTTKTKAAKYDNIEGIEDMVPMLWSPVKVAYDKYALWGVSYWGPKRQKFYGFASHRVSKHDVYSMKRIIVITHVKVMKWYDYRYAASLGSEEDFKPSKRCHLRFERSIKDVHQTSRHSEAGGRSSTGSRKLPEEA
ncbi:hypothetical protein Tco_0160474, partial [Tanacetum coccineum]